MKVPKRNIRSVFANNVAKRRRALGLNQRDFAAVAGIGESTLKEIETDVSPGSQPVKEAIAAALGCTVEDLFSTGVIEIKMNVTDPVTAEDIYEYIKKLERENKLLKTDKQTRNVASPKRPYSPKK